MFYLSLLIKLYARGGGVAVSYLRKNYKHKGDPFHINLSCQGPGFLDVSIYAGAHDREEVRHQLQLRVQFF